MNKLYPRSSLSREGGWISIVTLIILLGLNFQTNAQQGSQGNATIFNGAQATFFGDHTFVPGGTGTQNGIIKTIRTAPFGILAFGPAANHSGSSDASHVDGYSGKYGTSAFTFPIGNGTQIRPVSISAPASGDFKAAYWASNPNAAILPAGAPFPIANLGAGVSAVSNVEYWDVDGPSAINLTLTWDAASALDALTGSTIANLVVVGYNPATSKWENLGNAGGATGTLATTGTVTANGVIPDNYSAFTFASAGSVSVPDLRPLYVMSDVGFIKPSALTKNATLRIYNVGEATSVSSGPITVYIYPPNNQFTIALGSSPDWNLAYDGGGNYYTLTSATTTINYGAANFKPVNLVITAAPETSKGKYAINFEIGDGSGGETNNLNNSIPIDVTVSGL
jgi:hypothetical protein